MIEGVPGAGAQFEGLGLSNPPPNPKPLRLWFRV